MKYKTSGIAIIDIRGTVGGTTFSKNANGNQCYSRSPAINNHSSPSQKRTRGLLSIVSTRYRSLSPEQRTAWKEQATEFPHQHTIFGSSVVWNGRSLFMRLNCNRRLLGLPMLNDPPTPHPAIYFASTQWNSTTFNALSLAYNLSPYNILTRHLKLLIQSTQDISPGNTTPRNTRLINFNLSPLPSGVINIQASYFAEYGSNPAIGRKVFFTLRVMDTDTGETYAPMITSVIATP